MAEKHRGLQLTFRSFDHAVILYSGDDNNQDEGSKLI